MIKIGDKCEIVYACCHQARIHYLGEQGIFNGSDNITPWRCGFCGHKEFEATGWLEEPTSQANCVPLKWLRKLPGDVSEDIWDDIGWHPPKETHEIF